MEKIKNINKKYFILTGAMILVLMFLVVPQKAQAGMETVVIQLLSWVANAINYVIGELLLIAITILIRVANFGDFVNANIVQIGWVIMRDIANMIIVIALMVIAFGTTINKQTYHYQKLLPGLVIAAVLVNFSKVITGLMIDLSQVVMMPFVHAFHDIAAGNIIYGLGIEDMVNARNILESKMGVDVNDWTVFGALVMGVVMMAVALFVVASLAWMLLLRIIRLWVLIIFSPVAFVGNLLPVGKSYVGEWWGELNKQLVFGPTLAFMFWLSMSVLSQVTENNRLINLSMQSQISAGTATPETYNYFASQISSPQRVFDYLVTLALLIFCLMTAKKAGVMGADLAGKFMGKLENAGKWVTNKGSRLPFSTSGKLIGWGVRKSMPNTFAGKLAEDRYQKRKKAAIAKRQEFLKKMGVGEKSAEWLAEKLPKGTGADRWLSTKWSWAGRNKPFSKLADIPFGKTRKAAEKMTEDNEAAKRLANGLNTTNVADSARKWSKLARTNTYTDSDGINRRMGKAMGKLDVAAVNGLNEALNHPNQGANGGEGISNGDLKDLISAIASYVKAGGTAPQLGNITTVLERQAGARGGDLSGYTNINTLAGGDTITKGSFLKSDMNDLLEHNQMKQALDEFKLLPENKDLGEDELKQRFFRSERARQAYRQGNRDTGAFVNDAVNQGLNQEQLGELGVQNLAVRAGRLEFNEPTEIPSAEQMQANFERTEDEIRRITADTHEGVTMGQYGRRDGNNVLAVGFDELNEYMRRKNLGHVTGLEDKTSEGVMIQNVEEVRRGLAGMIQEQLNNLKNAGTNEEKVEALKLFGIQTDINNQNIEKLVSSAEAKGIAALDKLQNQDLVKNEGLILVNKNRTAGTAREVIRHEETHELMNQNDEAGEIRRDLADSLSQEMQARIDRHLQGRSDYGQLNQAQKLEEYAADVVAKKIQDLDFEEILLNSGLLSKAGQGRGTETQAVNIKEVQVSPEARTVIDNSGVLRDIAYLLQNQQNDQLQTAEKAREEWKKLREGVSSLSNEIEKMTDQSGSGLNKLSQQVKSLNKILPESGATSLEIKAAMQKNNTSYDDLRGFLRKFVK